MVLCCMEAQLLDGAICGTDASHYEAGVERLKAPTVDVSHQHYLHLRSLFADLAQASRHAHGRLLDIGCGNKPYEGMFKDHITEHVGCDVVQSDQNKVDIVCPATAIPLPDESFDTVLCTQVIEHVADHQSMLAEAFRLLRKGGTLILSGPMYWPLHEEPHDFFRFTKYGLQYLLEKTGFQISYIECNGGKWATCGQAIIHTIAATRLNYGFLIRGLNRLFAWLDDRKKICCNPMNYVLVARKRE